MNLTSQMALFYDATHIPVCCFDQKIMLHKFNHNLHDYNLPLLLFSSLPDTLPDAWYCFTPENMYFGGLRVQDSQKILFLGPVLLSECSIRQAESICRILGRKLQAAHDLQYYFAYSGAHTVPKLIASIRLLHQLIGQGIYDDITSKEIPCLPFEWNIPYPISDYPAPLITKQSTSELLETKLLSCIAAGNLSELNKLINYDILTTGPVPSLSITDMRTYILGTNMLASRTALSAGLDYQLVSELYGRYIQQILTARTASELSHTFIHSLQEYTKEVSQLNQLNTSSLIVQKIQQYVRIHYNEKITPHILADALHRNPSYLCTHFKKETGITISAYVQKEKIREAKRLLRGSLFSIAEISEGLSFSSQSYFGAVFKKITGMTPESYRLSHD